MRCRRSAASRGRRATSGIREPRESGRLTRRVTRPSHHRFALFVWGKVVEVEGDDDENHAMNATAIVKIVRGRKRCKVGCRGGLGLGVTTRAARRSLRADRIGASGSPAGKDRLLDDGRADEVVRRHRRLDRPQARWGPCPGARSGLTSGASMDWLSSVVATSPIPVEQPHVRRTSTTTASA